MPVPKPPVSLDGACTVIHDNTLFAYSPNGFQSISLEVGAKWRTLPMGEAVEGGVCVGADSANASQAGFYVVGGGRVGGQAFAGAPAACAGEYQGLQKYTYATDSWETLCPIMDQHAITQNRKWHDAIYIKASDSILIYSGTQDDVQALSSQTFTLQASAPYGSSSFDSMAPPAVQPILLPWDDSSAVMIGGDEANGRVVLFTTVGSPRWVDTGASLADPLPKRMRAALVHADDGSKSVYSFDLTTAPNVVNRIVLIDSAGAPITKSPTIIPRAEPLELSSSSSSSPLPSIAARDLTLQNWPAYNSTLASDTVRSFSAAAQDSDGRVIFTGGSDSDVMSIFDARKNTWENAAATFEDQAPMNADSASSTSTSSVASSSTISISSSTTTGSTTTGTIASTSAAVAATDSAAPGQSTGAEGDKAPTDPNVILGAAFGGLVGCALLLALFLLIARRCHAARHMQQSGGVQRNNRSPLPEKGEFSFNTNNNTNTSNTNINSINNINGNSKSINGGGSRFPLPPGAAQSRNRPMSATSYSSVAILVGHAENNGDITRKPSQNSDRTSASSLFNNEFKSTIGKPIAQAPRSPAPPYEVKAVVSFAQDAPPPRRRHPNDALDPEDPARRSSGWNRYWSGASILNSLGGGGGAKRQSEGAASSIYTDTPDYRMTQDSAALPSYFEGRPELNHVHSGSPTISLYPSETPIKEGMAGTIERPVSTDSQYSRQRESAVDTWPSVPGPWFPGHNPGLAENSRGHALTVPGSRPRKPSQSGVSQQPQLPTAAQSSDMSWLNLGEHSSGPDHV